MPGVNGICKQKVSLFAGIFELLLRQAVAWRNFQILAAICGRLDGR
jgi:hypothetical protein